MEKKVSLATYLMQLTIILLFLAILCFPLALMPPLEGISLFPPITASGSAR